MKSYKKRSILMGSILGKQTLVSQIILAKYTYVVHGDLKAEYAGATKPPKWLGTGKSDLDALKVFGKDSDDNNILHYCYMGDNIEVRELLR